MNGLVFVLLAISVSVKGQDWTVGTTIRYPGDATDIGESAFNALFRASPPYIIRRECPTCEDQYQKVIYYKRITPDNTWNAYKNMRSDWFDTNNVLNTNFILTNDLEAAIAGTNQFSYCNYNDPGIGSFRDCGRNGYIPGQWTSVNRGGKSARFSIYTPNHKDWTIGTTIRFPGDDTDLGEQAFNTLFRLHPHHIIRRECPSCSDANQKVIYYKRTTPDDTWNAYKNMRSDWFDDNNVLNTNFILTNDLDAAIAGTNQFALCNYDDPGIGSFRDCGRDRLIGGQWTSVTRGGHAARFAIYTPDLCVEVNCDDNDLCTDDACDPMTGECTHTDVICDDNDACTTDTCDALTGCGANDIICNDDGNVCNGDEGCSEGECISDGNAPVCEDWQVCEPGRGCIRNCHEFDIDGFLLDCSAEHEQNEEQLDMVDSRLDALVIEDDNHDDRLSDLEGRCDLIEPEVDTVAAYVGSPSDGSDPEESLFQLYEQLHADFEDLKSRVHGWEMPGDNVNDGDVQDENVVEGEFVPSFNDPTTFWYQYKEEIILGLVLVNIVLMVSIIYMCCVSKRISKKQRYSAVQFDSSVDEEENVALK